MKIYEEPHPLHGLTWRIAVVVNGIAEARGLIEPRPWIDLYDNGEPAPKWHGEHLPDISREEILSVARQVSDAILLREPNFGRRSLAILHAAMGGERSRADWGLEKKIKHLSNEHRRRVAAFVDRLLEAQK